MVMSLKATPRAVLRGINDLSTRQLPLETKSLPQHLPAMFLLTEKSDRVGIFGSVASSRIHGAKTYDKNSDFFNHQSVGASIAFENANQCMIIPIKLPDSKAASIRIAAEVVPVTINGKHVNRIIWHADPINSVIDEPIRTLGADAPIGNLGDGTSMLGLGEAMVNPNYREGSFTSTVTSETLGGLKDSSGKTYYAPSAYIPIIDLEVEATGAYGNQYGIMIEAPTINDMNPTDNVLANTLRNFIYRLTLVEKLTPTTSPVIIPTKYSSNQADFVLQPNTRNPQTNLDMSFIDVLGELYTYDGDTSIPTIESPFPKIGVYEENIELLLQSLATDYPVTAVSLDGESSTFTIPGVFGTSPTIQQDMYRINIFTGVDYEGEAYPCIDVSASRRFGGVRFGRDSAIFAQGGDDGFPMLLGSVDRLKLLQIFDESVRNWCDTFTDENAFSDSAKYPFSCVWDTGFSVETKKSLMKPTGQHKRIWSTIGTHAVADYRDPVRKDGFYYKPALSPAEEIAMGMLLRSVALMIPESEEYGTPTVRIAIVSRSGKLIDKTTRQRLPLTLEVLDKVSKYMGAGDGLWEPTQGFDRHPNNIVSLFEDINVTYQSPKAYNQSWDAGIMWVQNFDTESTFIPAFRTVYPNDTSVLTSYINMVACCTIERVCEQSWRKLVGDEKLTDDEFITASDDMIAEALNGLFDGRYRVVVTTMYTQTDKILGYRWTTIIDFYAGNMRTVGQFTINSRRRSDYAAAA